jgi:transcriptional regulatory protein LevR
MSFVVALCTTGEGSAAFLKSRLEGILGAERGAVEVLSLGIAAVGSAREALRAVEARGRVLCVVSPFRLELPYREFGADEVLTEAGLERVRAFVDGELLFEKIIAAQAEAFHEVDAREALESARDFVESVEEGLGRKLLDGPRVGVYCHIASLLEREKRGEECPPFLDRKAFLERNEDAFQLVRNEATRLESRFAIRLSADEVCRLVSFFAPENCAERAGRDAQEGLSPTARAAAPA